MGTGQNPISRLGNIQRASLERSSGGSSEASRRRRARSIAHHGAGRGRDLGRALGLSWRRNARRRVLRVRAAYFGRRVSGRLERAVLGGAHSERASAHVRSGRPRLRRLRTCVLKHGTKVSKTGRSDAPVTAPPMARVCTAFRSRRRVEGESRNRSAHVDAAVSLAHAVECIHDQREIS